MKKNERIYLKLNDGFVKIAHLIESETLIKISLDQEKQNKFEKYNEITIHDKKIHRKDLHYKYFLENKPNFMGDIPENNGYPQETTLNGESVGFENIPKFLVLPILETQFTNGIRTDLLSNEIKKEGIILNVNKNSTERFIFNILFTKNINNHIDITLKNRLIVETEKGFVIFGIKYYSTLF